MNTLALRFATASNVPAAPLSPRGFGSLRKSRYLTLAIRKLEDVGAIKTAYGSVEGQNKLAPDWQHIRQLITNNEVVPFVGAGASLSCGLPSGRTLANKLAMKYGLSDDEVNTSDLLDVASAIQTFTDDFRVHIELERIFREPVTPAPFHRWLARRRPKLILTTNYDNAIELAFLATGEPFHVILPSYRKESRQVSLRCCSVNTAVRPADYDERFDIFALESTVIYKLHGGVSPDSSWDRSSAIITEGDYFDIGGRIYAETILPLSIQHLLSVSSLLFVGYSFRDVHVRQLISQMRRYSEKNNFVVTLKPGRLDAARLRKLGFETFDMSADDFAQFIEVGAL